MVVSIDKKNNIVFKDIAYSAIDRDVHYVCCTGNYGEVLHDYIDEVIVAREVGAVEGHLPINDVVTTWHNDGLSDALWYALHCSGDAGDVLMLDVCEIQAEPDWGELIEGWNQID